MPEGPECLTFTDQLNQKFKNQNLISIEFLSTGRFKNSSEELSLLSFPLNNLNFHCKGKFLYWTFNNSDVVFFITLGMTGSFGSQSKHSAIKFTTDKSEFFFNDIRHFGTFKISNKSELKNKLESLGYDPLQKNYLAIVGLIRKIKSSSKTIGELLLDQSIFAGLGNYLRSEILYHAKIHPNRLCKALNDCDVYDIFHYFAEISQKSYSLQGTSLFTYSDMNNNKGGFGDFLKIYSRKTTLDTNNKITKVKCADGRTCFIDELIQNN